MELETFVRKRSNILCKTRQGSEVNHIVRRRIGAGGRGVVSVEQGGGAMPKEEPGGEVTFGAEQGDGSDTQVTHLY